MKKLLVIIAFVALLTACKEETIEVSSTDVIKQIQKTTETIGNNIQEKEKEVYGKTKNDFPLNFTSVNNTALYEPTSSQTSSTSVNYTIKSYTPVKGYYNWISDSPTVPAEGEIWVLTEIEVENLGKENFLLNSPTYYLKSADDYKFEPNDYELRKVLAAHEIIESSIVELPHSVNPLQKITTYALFSVNEELFNNKGLNFVLEEFNLDKSAQFGYKTEEVLIKVK